MSQDRLPESESIDVISTTEIVEIIQEQDRRLIDAMSGQKRNIALSVDQIYERLSVGGRLHYIGAGTSGRIAMLDAAEIAPTYGTDRDLVNVIMAGGKDAFLAAAEGAEDREEDAIEAINLEVTANDAVVGIAASGTTPFTLAGVRRANMIGALTVAVVARKGSPLAAEADIAIEIETGPEVVMGSTRMKAGTSQKLVLNTISTAVMIRLGRTYSNLMINMPATNIKLRSRAETIVQLATGSTRMRSRQLLEQAGGDMRVAVTIAKTGLSEKQAREKLEAHGGNLREALGE